MGRRYTIDATGITAHHWGIYHLHHPWDYFNYAGVYCVRVGKTDRDFMIVCSKDEWCKRNKTKHYIWMLGRPFSLVHMRYTPERFDEIKKYCPHLDYCDDVRRIREFYRAELAQRQKKKRS